MLSATTPRFANTPAATRSAHCVGRSGRSQFDVDGSIAADQAAPRLRCPVRSYSFRRWRFRSNRRHVVDLHDTIAGFDAGRSAGLPAYTIRTADAGLILASSVSLASASRPGGLILRCVIIVFVAAASVRLAGRPHRQNAQERMAKRGQLAGQRDRPLDLFVAALDNHATLSPP